ncbi:hypothetical protein [Paenibacillus sanfengchensis]|uniref:hypothetical protein n=1 Tax=Paenibacillus sanfengchensis TaxID=3119819 RepID=UPI002FE24D19
MRWVGWLLRLVATVVIVSFLTVLTTGYVVNTYIQSLLESYHLPITAEAPSLGSVVKGMFGFGGSKDRGSDPKNSVADASKRADSAAGSSVGSHDAGSGAGKGVSEGAGAANGAAGGAGGATGAAGGPGAATGTASGDGGAARGTESRTGANVDEKPPEDSLPVMGGISGSGGSGGQGGAGQDQQVIVTPDQMVAMKDGLPDKEKEEVFAMLMAKLPQEEMQRITELMEDGLTEKEMIEIEQILSKHLNKTEYAKIMDLLKGD